MLTSLNNSISRRGFKVTQDGLHIEYVNKNNEAEVSDNRREVSDNRTPAVPTDIVLSSNTSSSSSYSRITTATLPTCPFVTTDYYDKIVATDDNSTNVNRLMMKCANYFCDALFVQEKVVDLERQIHELKQKQNNIWGKCKDLILKEYPYRSLTSEDKELCFKAFGLLEDRSR